MVVPPFRFWHLLSCKTCCLIWAIVAHFKTPPNMVKLTEISLSFYISLVSYPLTGYNRKIDISLLVMSHRLLLKERLVGNKEVDIANRNR